MTILYGVDDEPAAFRRYYEDVHIPLAREMEGLTGWNLSWIEIDPAAPGPYQLVAELYTETAEAMQTMLASPAGRAASADLANFVTGTVEFLTGPETQIALADHVDPHHDHEQEEQVTP